MKNVIPCLAALATLSGCGGSGALPGPSADTEQRLHTLENEMAQARRDIDALKKTAHTLSGARLGVATVKTDKGIGVTVTDVDPYGPAAAAGITIGDSIIRVGNTRVNDSQAFDAALATYTAGDVAEIEIDSPRKNAADKEHGVLVKMVKFAARTR